MSSGAAIIGGSVVSGLLASQSSRASRRDLEAQIAAFTAEETRRFDLTRADLAPFRTGSQAALVPILNLLGIPIPDDLRQALGGEEGVPLPGEDFKFEETPGFQFRLEQGEEALLRQQEARGTNLNPAAFKDLLRLNQGFSEQEFGNTTNRLFSLAGINPGTVNQPPSAAPIAGQAQAGQFRIGGAQGVNQAVQGGISNALFLRMHNDLLNRIPSGPTPLQQSGPF